MDARVKPAHDALWGQRSPFFTSPLADVGSRSQRHVIPDNASCHSASKARVNALSVR